MKITIFSLLLLCICSCSTNKELKRIEENQLRLEKLIEQQILTRNLITLDWQLKHSKDIQMLQQEAGNLWWAELNKDGTNIKIWFNHKPYANLIYDRTDSTDRLRHIYKPPK